MFVKSAVSNGDGDVNKKLCQRSNRLRLAKQQLCMCNTQQQHRQTLRNGHDGQGSFQKSQHMYTAKSKKVALVNSHWQLETGHLGYGTMQWFTWVNIDLLMIYLLCVAK